MVGFNQNSNFRNIVYVILLGHSLFQEHASIQRNHQASLQYNLRRSRLERWSNFEIQVFIYSNDENVARILLSYFNKVFNTFLSKVQQSYCYSQLCSYREEFKFKPTSSQFNIFVGCNLNFTKSLNVSYLKMDGYSSVD